MVNTKNMNVKTVCACATISSENSSDMSDMSDIRPFWSDMSDICLFGLICLILDEFCLISDHFPPNVCCSYIIKCDLKYLQMSKSRYKVKYEPKISKHASSFGRLFIDKVTP